MRTRWGEGVTPEDAWPDYPRPQMVRAGWRNLNGLWDYAIAARRDPQPATWDGKILVPFCVESALSGVGRRVSEAERLWYRRSFALSQTIERTLLHFGAVDYETAVWVNGAFAGAHRGGFDPFCLDLTDFVHDGDNELIVSVDDPTSGADQPRGKQHRNPQGIWYTPVTGIWQTVWIEQVPLENHIEEVRITPTPACDAVEIAVLLARPSRDPELAVELVVSEGGKPVTRLIARADRKSHLTIPDPKLWSPDHPALYDVEVRLVRVADPLPSDNDQQAAASLLREVPLRGETEADCYAGASITGRVLDEVRCYFGLRHIEVGPHPTTNRPTLLLNGEPVFHLGTLDQGWWPDGLHTPPTDAAMVYEIEYLKAAGFNTVRKHIKVEPARYYYHCDRLGLLLWQDMPSGFLPAQFVAPNDEDEGLRSATATEQYELELQRMIHRLRNHPCIVVWVLHNEGWGQFDTMRLARQIKSLDPTRVVNAVSGWLDMDSGDLIDRHDYQATPAAPSADGRRALVIGEYGGIGWPIAGHLWNPKMRNWGYQTFHHATEVQAAYTRTAEAIIAMHRDHGVCAAIYTQTTDVEGEVNGLLTYDRSVEKLAADWLALVHAPLRNSPVP